MHKIEKQLLKQELKQCKSVAEMFALLESRYDLENARPNSFIKNDFINGIIKGIDYVKPTVKIAKVK